MHSFALHVGMLMGWHEFLIGRLCVHWLHACVRVLGLHALHICSLLVVAAVSLMCPAIGFTFEKLLLCCMTLAKV